MALKYSVLPWENTDISGTTIQERIDKTTNFWNQLVSLSDPQHSYHIILYCASPCRMNYVLRCAPPHISFTKAQMFGSGMPRVLEEIHGAVTNFIWMCTQLPTRMQGLGLTPSSHVFLTSSLMSSFHLIRGILQGASLSLTNHIGNPLTTLCNTYEIHENYRRSISSCLNYNFPPETVLNRPWVFSTIHVYVLSWLFILIIPMLFAIGYVFDLHPL